MKQTLKRILLLVVLLATQNYAENLRVDDLAVPMFPEESREGWSGTIGLGGHYTSFDNSFDSQTSIASSLKIGYHFTEQFAMEYVRNISWYSLGDDLFISGITGLGATYYFLPQQETWYASFVAGIGDFANIDDSGSETGSAFMATIGYEFAPHWQAEASWMTTSIDDSYNATLDTSSIQLLINYSWY